MQAAKGEAAIASAKKAYDTYKQIFHSERWQKLADADARPQRLLWASTSSKDPAARDTKYMEALIGPGTVNTTPVETIDAFRDHGIVNDTLEQGLDAAEDTLNQIRHAGIDMQQISRQLEEEAIEKFNQPFKKMLAAIAEKRAG
ncbi:transaldolase family protein [Mucilaginibacter pedocola]|nr:transaldolase family protein [Mucilaginibacter pedocola]